MESEETLRLGYFLDSHLNNIEEECFVFLKDGFDFLGFLLYRSLMEFNLMVRLWIEMLWR